MVAIASLSGEQGKTTTAFFLGKLLSQSKKVLSRTLELVQSLEKLGAFNGSVLGIVPFRDRWFGRSQSKDSAAAIAAMKQLAPELTVFSSILESERYQSKSKAMISA